MRRLIPALTLGLLGIQGNALAQQQTAAEIQAYCARTRNTAETGEDRLYPAQFPTLWRCMNGSVYTCEVGASGRQCSHAGHSTAPTEGVITWCRQTPNADFVPGAYLSNAAITWRCDGTRPVVVETEAVDERGYVKRYWRKVGP